MGKQNHSPYFDRVYLKADSMDPDRKDRAFAYLDSVYSAFPDPGPEDLYRKYDYSRHYFYETRKDYPEALVYVDSAIGIVRSVADRQPYTEDYGRALFAKGDILLSEGKYNDAFVYYYQGRQVIGKINDTCLLGEYNDRLGIAYYRKAMYKEAMTYFKGTVADLAFCTGRDTFTGFAYRQGDLDNIALCYWKIGSLDSARYYYDSALHFIHQQEGKFQEKASDKRFIEVAKGVIYGNEGEVYFRQGNKDAALSLYKASIAINSQEEYANEDAELTRGKLIRLYLSDGRYREAAEELGLLKGSLDSVPGREAQLQWLQLQGSYDDSIRRPGEAYAYFKRYIALKDSLEVKERPVDMNEELEHLQHEYELGLLRKQDELKSVYLFLSILFLVMAVIILALVGHNWRRSRKNVDHMQKALGALEQSQQDNTRIMKVVAHDLRNPIGAIGSIVAILLKDQGIAKEQRKMLELVRASSLSSLELISGLLRAGTMEEMRMEAVDIETALRYCVQLLQFKATAKQQRIVLHSLPVTIRADREKIWRVLSNLITNAIKFSPLRAEISVDMCLLGDRVCLWVKDQGIGIPEDMREKIFDLFTPAKREGTTGEESFGLGLGISRQIVEAHGGRIWYESEVGQGTIFYVELPLDRV
jgi:signal transduction histidine kinase